MKTTQINTCPSGPILQQLVLGQLDEFESDTIETHLETCAECRQVLDQLSDSDLLNEWQTVRQKNKDGFSFLAQPIRPGDLGSIDHYAIEAVVGRGGSGVVFRATDRELGRAVAVKVLTFDLHHRATERFLRESRSAARTSGDHVVTVFATGNTIDNRPYLVMPLVEGESLRSRLAHSAPEPEDSARLIRDAALGLATIHASGILHRDVKPANILIEADSGRAKITDFGLARASDDETFTQTNMLCGTPEYMSPEQATSSTELSEASDIYSLGISLYECLTETPPFRGRPLQVLEQHRLTEPLRPSRLNPSIPRDLETICLKAICKSPSLRYPSAMAMADDLKRFIDGRPVLARETTQLERFQMWCGRNRLLATLSATSIGLLILLAVGSTISVIQLSRANASILEKQGLVKAAEEKASQDRTAAVESLNRLVDSLYTDLSKNAATIKTREKIVEAVISGLDSLAQIEGDVASNRTALKAWSRIADLHSLQGANAKAEEAFDSSIKLARSLAEDQPGNPDAQRELAKSLDQLAVHYSRINNFAPMTGIADEISQILNRLLVANPNDLSALRMLVTSHSRTIDYHWLNSPPEKSLELTRAAIDDVNRLLELENDNSENYRVANDLHSRLGRAWLESGNLQQAEIEFNLARETIDRATELAGEDPKIQLQSAVTSRMRGVLLNSIGKQNESLKSFGLALAGFRKLAEADADDFMLQQNIANTLLLAVQTETSLGRVEDAIAANVEAIDLYNQTMRSTETNATVRSLLVQAHMSLAGLYERMHRWEEAADHSAAAIQMIDGDQTVPPLTAPVFEMIRRNAVSASRAQLFMKDESATLEAPAEIAAVLFLVACIEATDSTDDLLSESTLNRLKFITPDKNMTSFAELVSCISSQLGEIPELQMMQDFLAARIWGLRGKTLADSLLTENSDELAYKQRLVLECTARAMEHLSTFAKNFPSVAFEIYKEPDFIWLRNTPEFLASGLAMPGADLK